MCIRDRVSTQSTGPTSREMDSRLLYERQQAAHKLSIKAQTEGPAAVICAEPEICEALAGSEPWELQHGGLLCCQAVLQSGHAQSAFVESLDEILVKLLSHSEHRVRAAAADVIRVAAPMWTVDKQEQLASLVLQELQLRVTATPSTELSAPEDTEGWSFLESWIKGLDACVASCQAPSSELMNSAVQLVSSALGHSNRFVREGAAMVLGSVCQVCAAEDLSEEIHLHIASLLAATLSDNWSQVRYAGCTSTRSFLQLLQDPTPHFRALLPPLCLNRYYVAVGVKTLSQQVWRSAVGENGLQVVTDLVDAMFEFLEKQADADNHAVREAACQCLADRCLSLIHI
eukprot:TRINITY_DN14162_c0_g1_i2.p1 TRINITY_DN14162_c0_g1~~TRINITY_DN14162_c0_g1_i2.p1  ORF type:complete len:344 (-),score=86.72 TRINITY_DN14162_c0_g1_i2:102-1133(-)